MQSMLEPILGNVRPEILLMFAGFMFICFILSLIKKVIKLAVVVAGLAAVAVMVAPIATEFQKNYSFRIEDSVAIIVVDGKEYTLDYLDCESMELENTGNGYEVRVEMEDGVFNIIIPPFMLDGMKDFADRYAIPLKLLE